METAAVGHDGILAADWVRATTVGWFLGFLVMMGILVIAETVGLHGQAMIGIGMGAGVGYWQSRLLRGRLDRPHRWVVATVVGLGTPFLLWDLSALAGAAFPASVALPSCVVVGGLLVALWQWRLLRPHGERASRWIAPCAIGWTLPALAMALSDAAAVPGPLGVVAGLLGMFFGGLMLGGVTAAPLAGLMRGFP